MGISIAPGRTAKREQAKPLLSADVDAHRLVHEQHVTRRRVLAEQIHSPFPQPLRLLGASLDSAVAAAGLHVPGDGPLDIQDDPS
jgi:hypothetical protein